MPDALEYLEETIIRGCEQAIANGLPEHHSLVTRVCWGAWCRLGSRGRGRASDSYWPDVFGSKPLEDAVKWSDLAWCVAIEDPEPRNTPDDLEVPIVELQAHQRVSMLTWMEQMGLLKTDDDAAQEAMTSMYRSYFRAGSSTRYLCVASLRGHFQMIRDRKMLRQKQRRHKSSSLNSFPEGLEDGRTASGLRLVEDEESRAELRRSMVLLTPEQRLVLGLRARGLANAQIARNLGMKRGAVTQMIQRAEARLRGAGGGSAQ